MRAGFAWVTKGWVRLLLGLILWPLPADLARAFTTTTVQGTIYRADGSVAKGTVIVTWPAFTTASNEAIAAGNMTAEIGDDGFTSMNLAPNVGALPTGTYYTAVLHLSDGTVSKEYWLVPAQGNASITTVRAQLAPATVAVQTVSKSYVDASIANASGSYLPAAGGTLNGPLTLPGDPNGAMQAATKQYVDHTSGNATKIQGVSVATAVPGDQQSLVYQAGSGQFVPKDVLAVANAAQATANAALPIFGGKLNGPLTLAGDPLSGLQAATKQYVDSAAQTIANTALSLSGGKVTGPLQALAVGSNYFASQYPGQSNNGIALTFGDAAKCPAGTGCTVVADPSYPVNEHYGTASYAQIGPPGNYQHLIDNRMGQQGHYFHNWPNQYRANLNGWAMSDAMINVCFETAIPDYVGGAGSVSNTSNCLHNMSYYYGPGVSLGNPNNGPGGWTTHLNTSLVNQDAQPGISGVLELSQVKTAIGDNVGYYSYVLNYGGATAASDEGQHNWAGLSGEASTFYTGTVTTGGAGATSLITTCTADCGNQGDGRYLLKTTAPVATGYVTARTGPGGGIGDTPGTFTISTSVTPSTAWGTLAANVNTPVSNSITAPTNMTFAVNGLSGAFTAGSLVCFSGMFHEQAMISAVTGTGPYTITIPLRHAHEANSWIMQGGPCGTFIEFTANTTNSIKFPVDVIGATSANTLVYRYFAYAQGGFAGGYWPGNVQIAQYGATSMTNTGGIVTMKLTGASMQQHSELYGNNTVTISGAANSAFNGACTNTFTTPGSGGANLSCSQGASTGQASASASVAYGTTPSGNAGFNLWSGAEVLDVLDYSVSPPQADGHFLLEPNGTTWNAGDTVENSHHAALSADFAHQTFTVYNPMHLSNDVRLLQFSGVGGGNPGCPTCFSVESIRNTTPTSRYKYHGGSVSPPGGIFLGGNGSVDGVFAFGLSMQYAPDSAGGVGVQFGCPFTGCSDVNYYYSPMVMLGNGGNNGGISYRPYGNEVTIAGNLVTGPLGTIQTYDRLAFYPMVTPVNGTFTTSSTGGTLADASSYCYRIAASNSTGYTLAGPETCKTTGTGGGTNSITLLWNRIQGASGYKVYGRSAGAEQLIATVNGADAVNWTDTGTVAPSGAMPSTDTSLGGVANASSVGLHAATSGYAATLQAPAALVANATMTLPGGSGTLALNIPFVGSGASHASGLVPDPGATAGTTRFLREDGSWTTLSQNNFAGSGSGHSSGLVPDPGATAGSTRFLREDGSWATATVANTTVTPGSYTSANITVGADGRVTSATSGGAGGFPTVVAHVSLTGQATGLSNIFSYIPAVDGTFRLTTSIFIITPCTSGTLSLVPLALTPVTGHAISLPSNVQVNCAVPYNGGFASVTAHSAAGSAISPGVSFTSVVGSPLYNVDVILEQLQ